MSDFSERWNSLSEGTKKYLIPCLIEAQILHYEQAKNKAVRAHKKLMSDYKDHIKNLKIELNQYINEETRFTRKRKASNEQQ